MRRRPDRHGAQAMRQLLLDSRDRFWTTAELDAPSSTVQHVLAELVRLGELRRIRRGLYWRGIKTPLGMSPPSPQALAGQLIGKPGFGPAGFSAANALRLSNQIPRRAEYAVPFRPPADAGALHFVDRSSRRGRADRELSPTEVAVLEVLDGWHRIIDTSPGLAMARLRELIVAGKVDGCQVAAAANTEPGAARARLRHLLCYAGRADLAEKVAAVDPGAERRALAGLVASS